MAPVSAIMILRIKDYHTEVIISSLQVVIGCPYRIIPVVPLFIGFMVPDNVCSKVQVGKDQEKEQSEKDSHSKNRGGKKTN